MTAHVSPDAPRPPSGIRDSGGPMPFNEADFTRDAARMVAEGDRVPEQRWHDGHVTGEPRKVSSGTIVLMDGDRPVSEEQPCEMWLEEVSGAALTFSIRHPEMIVTASATQPRAVVRDVEGQVLWETPVAEALPAVEPGWTVKHSPMRWA